MKKLLALCMVVFWCSPGISQAVLSNMMTDPGTSQVFSDDFEDGTYTDKWTTYTNASAALFKEEGGYLHAQVTSGEPWTNAHFYTLNSLDVSAATGRKTEVVMSLCNYQPYIYTHNYLLNTQHPWGKGFCIEHQMYPYGHIRLSLYNNGIVSYLYDSGDMGSYQYGYSVSLVVDPMTGNWSFGWAGDLNGVTTPVASGTLTAEQLATYLSSTMYIGTGIYTEWSGDVNSNINRTFDVAVYQVTKTAIPTFSPWGPYIHGETTVAIASATPGAQIYYTTDGNTPTTGSSLYVDPVPVVDGMTLKAIAVAPRLDPSGVASQQYIVWDSMSHLMNDPGTTRVFWDDFSDDSFTDNWVTYSNTGATFEQTGGAAIEAITSGETWSYAYLFSNTSLNVSATTGKRTEIVLAECNLAPYNYNRTFLLNSQNPWGKGICIEHQFFPIGDIRVSLYDNGGMVTLFDGPDRAGYEFDHSIGVIIDPKTGEWRVGWTWNDTGIMVPVGSGVLTPEQIANYLSETMYIGSGIYSGGYASNTINRTYEVAAYQATVPAAGTAFTDEFNLLDPSRWFVVTSQAAKGKAVQSNANNTDSQTINFFGTNPASRNVSVNSSGQLVLPINAGDTYQNENNYSNVVVARAPENWSTITVKVKGSQAFNDTLGWNQFNIVLWNNDNNLVKFGFSHFDSTSTDPQAGHMVVGGSIETRGTRHTTFGVVDDTISNAIDLVLKVEKNTDGTYKYSISKDNGATMTVVANNVAFAEADGSNVQIPMYVGVYAGAGRWTETFGSDWWTYDPTSNRNVDVLVDSFSIGSVSSIPGDANRDGKVNFSDYLLLSQNFAKTNTTWEQGNFNTDNVTNFSDYLLLSQNFGKSNGASDEEIAQFKAASEGLIAQEETQGIQQTLPCSALGLAVLSVVGLALYSLSFREQE